MNMLDVAALLAVTDSFKGSDWTEEIIAYCENGLTPSVKAIKHAQELIGDFLQKGHSGRAYNWAFLLVQLTRGQIVSDPRFSELFRPTKREAKLSKVVEVLRRLSEQARKHSSISVADTFASWRAYSELYTEMLRIEARLLDSVRATKRGLAWIVSYAEEMFAFDNELLHPPTLEKRHRFDLRKEEVATTASYLLGRYFHRWGFAQRDFPILPELTKPPEVVGQWLLQGYFLSEIRNLEPSIFRFGSRCNWTDKRTLVVAHPDQRIDMSLELGYVKTELFGAQAAIAKIDERTAFSEICKRFNEEYASRFVKIATEGSRRLQIAIPEPVAKILGDYIFAPDGVYTEEVRESLSLCWEFNTTPDELHEFKVTENLTLFDLVKIGRVFRLLASARNEQLSAMRDSDPECYWNSMLGGSLSRDDLARLLTLFSIDARKAQDYVALFVWRPLDDERPLDLQYTSFIPFSNRLAIPFNIHAQSNALRNALVLEKKRLYEDGATDPVSKGLSAALCQRSDYVDAGIEYRWQQQSGDLDVITLLDGKLYVFECKNTLLPCSAFERRTLWDHLQKAVVQLDRFRILWSSLDFRQYLANKLKWPIGAATELRTCIVPSVRLFSGAKIHEHPIRHNRELCNIISTGKGEFVSAKGDVCLVNLWRASAFSSSVMDEYLSQDAELYQAYWDAMNPQSERFEVGDFQVSNRRYILDWERLEIELRSKGFVSPSAPTST